MSARGRWPTAEEAATLFTSNVHIPPSSMQILTLEDLDLLVDWEKSDKRKEEQASRDPELVRLVREGDVGVVDAFLVAHGSSVDYGDLDTALLTACEDSGDPTMVHALLDAGADVNSQSNDKDSALHLALYAGHEQIAETLIESGADVRSHGRLGRTPLHVAAVQKLHYLSSLLLEYGADIEAQDDGTWTPIHLSCGYKSPVVTSTLIMRGANVNYQDEDGWTALHQATCHDNATAVQLLLDAGANADLKTSPAGLSALQIAIIYEKIGPIRCLIEQGVRLDDYSAAGFTTLQLAVLADSEPIVRELVITSEQLIDQRSTDGATALHIACGRGLNTVVELLLDAGADTTLKDTDGLNAHELASKFGHRSTARLIERKESSSDIMPMLCSMCKEHDIMAVLTHGAFGLKSLKLGNYESLVQRRACPFCAMVLSMLPCDAHKYDTEKDNRSVIELRRVGAVHTALALTFNDMRQGFIELDKRPKLSQQMQSISLGKKYFAAEKLDYAVIRSWVTSCDKEHNAQPFRTDILTPQREVQRIYLIDVEDRCLATGTIDSTYVALSYVWGQTKSFQTTRAMEQSMLRKGSLESVDIPLVVRDAMECVQKLGEKYLWVDSICIVQDDTVSKQKQLEQMDLVYTHAWLTIVSLSAFDADSGLPGLKPRFRAAMQSTLYVDGHRLITRPPDFDDMFRDAKYTSRAWTLQENILSPRCLYVTSHEVYYSCHGTLLTQSHGVVTNSKPDAVRAVSWFAEALSHTSPDGKPAVPTKDWMDYFTTYTTLVRQCTSRKLSYPSDVLNAVLGPLTLLSRYLGSFSLAGLPDRYLDHALLWRPDGAGPKTRNHHFPSWSWAGWHCSCSYYDGPVFLGINNNPIELDSAISRFETFWQTSPKTVDSLQIKEASNQPADREICSWSLEQSQDRAASVQVLAFTTEVLQRGYFDIVEARPELRMMVPPSNVCTLLDGDHHCGVIYDDIKSLQDAIETNTEWSYSFILLSRTDAPPDAQDFFFNTDVYEQRPKCLLNVMLIKERYSSVFTAVDRILQRGIVNRDTPVAQISERVAIGQIHEDAWQKGKAYMWQVLLS